MNSSEGENIMFLSCTVLEGPVEVCLHSPSYVLPTVHYCRITFVS